MSKQDFYYDSDDESDVSPEVYVQVTETCDEILSSITKESLATLNQDDLDFTIQQLYSLMYKKTVEELKVYDIQDYAFYLMARGDEKLYYCCFLG
jgi:hypothetical protein